MGKQIIAGLDVGTAAIRLAVCEVERGKKEPRVLALVKRASRGLRRGYIINPEEARQCIGEAVAEGAKAARARLRTVVIGVGGITLESKTADGQVAVARADSEITEADINRSVELGEASLTGLANSTILHSLPISFKLEGKKIYGRPEGLQGGKLETKTLFITCLKQHLNDLVRATESSRVEVAEVVAAPLAAASVVLSPTQRAAGCVLVNIGSQTTSLIVFEDGLPLSVQVFPIGSTDVTNDIALGLQVPLEEAERLKLDPVNNNIATRRKLDEIIEARLSDMFDYIEGHLKKLGKNGLLPAGIVITGGGSNVRDIDKLARQILRLPARVPDSAADSYALPREINDPNWAVAYGLCRHGLENQDRASALGRHWRSTKKQLGRWLKELLP